METPKTADQFILTDAKAICEEILEGFCRYGKSGRLLESCQRVK